MVRKNLFFDINLNHKLKNAKYNVVMSSHRKHLSGDHWKTSTARETTSGFKKKDSIQPDLNVKNLALIMKDANNEHDYEKMLRLKELDNQNMILKKQEQEIKKYIKFDKSHLYSEEARKSLIKFKVYKVKKDLSRNPDDVVKSINVSSKVINEQEF